MEISLSVVDVNECIRKLDDCNEDQRCENTRGGYRCVSPCDSGFEVAANSTCVGK